MAMSDTHPSTPTASRLAQLGVTVFERGWLSSNNVLVQGAESSALVDSGYCTHSSQTVALVQDALKMRPLDLLLNTHLHSDHCGGNAALQSSFPQLKTLIPPGQAAAVANWDPVTLTHEPTGQTCPAFHFQGVLAPGDTVRLGDVDWEIHAAKGHDPHSVVLFEPNNRVLISADALWESGFGVVFPELEGIDAFEEVADTLSVIEALNPMMVIPGHGPVFDGVESALQRARSRLDQFVKNPEKHRRYALKVLLKFKLLEWQSVNFNDLLVWYAKTPYISSIEQRPVSPDPQTLRLSLNSLIADLAKSNALRVDGDRIIDA
jgi:glyoxylase-like metal-dependent hydrolase (beta-lactamase superfamily II)